MNLKTISLSILLTTMAFASEEPQTPTVPPAEHVQPTAEPAAQPDLNSGMLWGTVIKRSDFKPLTGKERWGLYWRQTYFTPGVYFAAGGPALGGQMKNEPPEWGQGAEGYAKRFANQFARNAIRDSITAGGSAALGYEVRYVRCDCKGIMPRVGHALLWNFLTLNRQGKTVVNAPAIGSSFAAEFIGNTWMPPRYNTASNAFRNGGVQLAINSAFNIVREFLPYKNRKAPKG
jgi:hypothetical protein